MSTLLGLLTVHFVADFVCQSDWMAQNKSKRWDALTIHVGIYTACFVPFLALTIQDIPAESRFLALTFALHFVQDAITSRINSRLWAAKKVHWFFVGIGGDQLLHAYALALAWSITQ